MRERRKVERRAVAVAEARIAEGFDGAVRTVRVLNLSDHGVEIETDGAGIDDHDLSVRLGADGVLRKARIAWRQMERFGLAFEPVGGSRRKSLSADRASQPARPVLTRWRPPSLSDVLLRDIIKSAGRR